MAHIYKSIKGVSNAVARCVVQDLAWANGRRVYSIKQFTVEDNEKIKNLAMRVESLLVHADDRYWNDVYDDIKSICGENFHLGFAGQEMILDTCRRNGIRIYLKH